MEKIKNIWNTEYSHECIEIDLNTIKSRIDKLAELGVKDMELVPNGEPFLYKSIFEIIKYAKYKDISIRIIFTNGTLLQENMIKQLKELYVKSISISLNAFTFKVWSEMSNTNNEKLFETAVNAPLLTMKYGLKTEVSYVICEENKSEVKAFLNYWVDKVDNFKSMSKNLIKMIS